MTPAIALAMVLLLYALPTAQGRAVAGGITAGFAASATLQVALGGVAPLWQRAACGSLSALRWSWLPS